MPTHDLVVVGSGTAAGVVARRARSAGWSVAVVDKHPIGGTCANRGCEPKKVLVGAARAVDAARRLHGRGLEPGRLGVDWPALAGFTRTFTDPVPTERTRAFERDGIEVVRGVARFVNRSSLTVGGRTLEAARAIVIAAGARPADLPFEGRDLVIDSTAFFALRELPPRIAFIGGGYVSMELAHVTARAGAQATVVHRGARPLTAFDPDLVDRLVARSREAGIDVRLETSVTRVTRDDAGALRVTVTRDGHDAELVVDLVVHGAGRVPDIDDLDLATGGVAREKAGVSVDAFLRSPTNPLVWAAGDCAATGAPALTPMASEEGERLADNLLDDARRTGDYTLVPGCVYTVPPLSRVGMSEAEARDGGRDVAVTFNDTASWASARRVAETASACKVLVDRASDAVVGAHLLGPHADEVINVFAVAMQAGMTATALRRARFAFPTSGSDVPSML